VCGTVNDLAVMGARPLALSLSLVIEEGLPTALLERIMDSLAAAADQAGVHIATGDTKVIERAHGDGLIITTAGIGQLHPDWRCTTREIVAGDCVIVTGHIAEHGLAVMSAREGLAFQTTLQSDAAPLNGLVDCILGADAGVKFMRDPTRSGIAGVLADLAEATDLSIEVNESSIPITPVTRHTAEMLGIDPLEVANEGKIVLVAPSDQAEAALEACRRHELGRHAAVIGRFVASKPALVELITPVGGRRLVQRPHGEQLPRIC
jgi:hydrogenase expression/formation protein HypE